MERLNIIKRNVFRIMINICIDYGDRDRGCNDDARDDGKDGDVMIARILRE